MKNTKCCKKKLTQLIRKSANEKQIKKYMDNLFPMFGGFPSFIGRTLVAPPVQPQEEKKEEKKPEKRSEPRKSVPHVEMNFPGRINDEPIYHATLGLFGLDMNDVSPIDRNQLTEIIKMTAQKLGTTDTTKILSFIKREARSFSGENKFREFYRTLLLSQKPEKRKNPWGR